MKAHILYIFWRQVLNRTNNIRNIHSPSVWVSHICPYISSHPILFTPAHFSGNFILIVNKSRKTMKSCCTFDSSRECQKVPILCLYFQGWCRPPPRSPRCGPRSPSPRSTPSWSSPRRGSASPGSDVPRQTGGCGHQPQETPTGK